MAKEESLKILYMATEVSPYAKTGGLADVAGSLPPAIKQLGHDIRVIMPRYGRIHPARFGLRSASDNYLVPIDTRRETAILWQADLGGVPVYMVDNARYFNREGLYAYADDAERFVFYCRAAMEGMRAIGWTPDVIHCNDWQTAFVSNWLKTIFVSDPMYQNTASLYTIHSLAFQGIFGTRVLEMAGIADYGFVTHPDMTQLNTVVDLMARGIYFSDVITTVSPTYANEILTPAFGEGLDPLLRSRQDVLYGVLNGIDTGQFDPERDSQLASNFNKDSLELRAENKRALQEAANLPVDPMAPLLGVISRLVDLKGIDLLSSMIEPIFQQLGAQLVLLGTGEQHYHERFTELQRNYPKQAGIFLTFNANLASLIYGGSDLFLMPSRVEPCGTGQMIAMRYGSVPVVHAIGGLADTVTDYDPASESGSGFAFNTAEPLAFYTAVVRAVEAYRRRPEWKRLQRRDMQVDFSWTRSARQYIAYYRQALALKRQEPHPPA
jgi:starch synthase